MKFKKLLAGAIFLCASTMFAQNSYVPSKALDADNGQSFHEYVKEMNTYYERLPVSQRKGWKQFKRWQHFWEQRIGEDGQFPKAKMLVDLFKEAKKIKTPDYLLSNKWNTLGPIGSPNTSSSRGKGIGRVNCLRLNPNNEQEIWVGAATGGVWKSLDGGQTWKTFDFTNYLSMGVTDIQIAPTNTNTIYVSTGDAHATYPNVNRSCYSVGILKSTDSGNNWEITALADSLGDRGIMGKIIVDPRNENIVVASTSAGIMKTTDGGNTWQMNEQGSFFDIAYSPANPNIILASTFVKNGGASLYRSTDLGDTWTKVLSKPAVSRLDIETENNYPESFWTISVDGTSHGSAKTLYDIQCSDDQGESFYDIYTVSEGGVNLLGRSSGTGSDLYVGQGEYDLAFAVNPLDYNRMYVGGIEVWRTANNGSKWDKKTVWYGGASDNYSHADHHDLVYNKDGSILYDCNDGGVFYTSDNGTTWHDLCGNMNIMQFHAFGNDQSNGDIVAGAQDNGSSAMIDGEWTYIGGGDGFEGIITPTDNKVYFYSIYNGVISKGYSPTGKYNTFLTPSSVGDKGTEGWQTAYILNPQNPYSMLVGYYDLYVGDINNNKSFVKIGDFSDNGTYISSIAVAESDTNTIYAAKQSILYKTTDYGQNWEVVFNAPNKITYIAVDPNNADRAWVTVSGFGNTKKVALIEGNEETDLTGNLPNVPVLTIVYQKNSPDRVYIGTDLGVFVSDNGSNYWELLGAEMPRMIVNELEIMESTQKLRACTYGRGIWETDLLTCSNKQIPINSDTDGDICEGNVVTLTAGIDEDSYLWSTGETTKSIEVTETGIYSVVSLKEWGCSDKSEPIKVSFIPVPELSITINGDIPFCGEGGSATFKAPFSFASYLWSNGSTERNIDVTEPGVYYLQADTKTGCIAYSDTIVVGRFDEAEVPTIERKDHRTLVSSESAAYQWYKDGNKMFGETSQELVLEKDAAYTVTITDENGCSATSEEIIINDMSVQEMIEDGRLTLSNNPSDGNFTLTFNEAITSNVEMTISNMIGERIMTKSFDMITIGQTINIDLTNQAKGMYFLNAKIGDTPSLIKLIVQ